MTTLTREWIKDHGVEDALRAHLDCCLIPPIPMAYPEALSAIRFVAQGKPDEPVLWDENGAPDAYAHHLVRLWELQPFVEAVKDEAAHDQVPDPRP